MTDGTRLRQILLNGLTNAIKYSSASATSIHVVVAAARGVVTFSVIDDGRGLPRGTTPDALFRDFNAVVTTPSAVIRERDKVRSTGLGLPISHRCGIAAAAVGAASFAMHAQPPRAAHHPSLPECESLPPGPITVR